MLTPGITAEIRGSWSISLSSTGARRSTLPVICCGLMPKVVPAPNGFSPITPTSFWLRQREQAVAAELPRQEEVREDDHRELRDTR